MKLVRFPFMRPGASVANTSRSTRSEEELVSQTERLLDCYYWALFKSDRGMLAREPQDRQIDQEDPTPPVNICGHNQQHGWIAEYLGFLNCIVSALLGSV